MLVALHVSWSGFLVLFWWRFHGLHPRVCKQWFPNGGSSFVGERRFATPFLPQTYLILSCFKPTYLTSNSLLAWSGISSHGLETTAYI